MTGLYLDYSLNNIQKVRNRHALEYQPSNPSVFVYNSILNTGLVNKMNFFGFGLKVALNF
jgi:hypothetical protein